MLYTIFTPGPDLLGRKPQDIDGFKIQVDTTIAAPPGSTNVTANDQFRYGILPTVGGYSFRIQWGDGSYDDVTCGAGVAPVIVGTQPVPGSSTAVGVYTPTYLFPFVPYLLHTYPAGGVYDITITPNEVGGLPSPICMTDPEQTALRSTDALKITKLKRWGVVPFIRYTNAFQGCSNLIITATDSERADMSACTHFGSAFERTAITTFPDFDIPAASNIQFTFFQAYSLQAVPLLKLSVSCGMWSTFRDCTSLTSVPAFDFSKVTSMESVFEGCTALTSVAAINASEATDLSRAFFGCTNLKASFIALAPSEMLDGTDFAKDSDLNSPSSAANQTNYDNLLSAWTGWSGGLPGAAGLALQDDVVINFGPATKYNSPDASAARSWLIGTKGWNITDGGAAFVGPFDAMTVPRHAYGFSRFFTAYDGPLVRLRRTSDNAEADFSALANGELDLAAIDAWRGAGVVARIVGLYDQVGSIGMYAPAAANQPFYADDTQVFSINGFPTGYWSNGYDTVLNMYTQVPVDILEARGVSQAFQTGSGRILSIRYTIAGTSDYSDGNNILLMGEKYAATRRLGAYYNNAPLADSPSADMTDNPFVWRCGKDTGNLSRNKDGEGQVSELRDLSAIITPSHVTWGNSKIGEGAGTEGRNPVLFLWYTSGLPDTTDYNLLRAWSAARFGTP